MSLRNMFPRGSVVEETQSLGTVSLRLVTASDRTFVSSGFAWSLVARPLLVPDHGHSGFRSKLGIIRNLGKRLFSTLEQLGSSELAKQTQEQQLSQWLRMDREA